MICSLKNNHEISYYDLYSIDTSSFTPPHTITIPLLHSIQNKNLRNVTADAYKAPPQNVTNATKATTKHRIRSLLPHSPHDTLSRSYLHTPYQRQATKRNSRHVRSSSPIHDSNFHEYVAMRRYTSTPSAPKLVACR